VGVRDTDLPRAVRRAPLADVRARIDAFLTGSMPLSGLCLYFLLERASPLIELHTILRPGARNRTRSGVQQSYGDHNRLLLLGLDALEDADLDWYRSRLERRGEISDGELLDCFALVGGLGLTPPIRVALWLAAALHDYGRLAAADGGTRIDVEDGVELSRDLVNALCPRGLHTVTAFVIRNHDYVKDVFLGEVPVAFIAEQIDALPPSTRDIALAALGLVQVAGAASLGEGRLHRFRLEIFRRCVDGGVLVDRSAGTRLARLFDPPRLQVPPAISREWDATIDTHGDPLRHFLERIPLHGWHRSGLGSGASTDLKLAVIRAIAQRFHDEFADHQHVVIGELVECESEAFSGVLPGCTSVELRNGTKAMIVGGGPASLDSGRHAE
jgi:hypothetical protein